MERFLANQQVTDLTDNIAELEAGFDTDINDAYPYVTLRRFLAISKFYQGDFSGSAKVINNMRNELSLKKYLFSDVESKLFQAMQYCYMGEDGLCGQILQSVKRQIPEDDRRFDPANTFIKILKAAIKPEEFRKKVKKLTDLHEQFRQTLTTPDSMLWFVKLDEPMLRRLANPIKD